MALDLEHLRGIFLDEFEERHATLQAGVLELAADPGALDRLVPELFRAAHSLKGGAQMVELPAVAAVCHRLEEVLAGLRDGSTVLDAGLQASLVGDVDALGALGDELRHDGPPPPPPRRAPGAGDRVAATDTPASVPPTPTERSSSPPSTASRDRRARVRVPAGRLDDVLDRAGEVLLARDELAQLERSQRDLLASVTVLDRRWREAGAPGSARDGGDRAEVDVAWRETRARIVDIDARTSRLRRSLHEVAVGLAHGTRSLRLQPFRLATEGLDRAVRELTRTHGGGTPVELRSSGGEVELDGEVVEALRDPLLHLVRNAVAHGVEPADERERAGKPRVATIAIEARLLGEHVEVVVDDDGAGIDVAALRARAGAAGVDLDDGRVAQLAWSAGLSTATTADAVAGRGVGLDAVRDAVEGLGGTAELSTTPGAGCRVTLTVPVTLATVHAVLVTAGEQTVAVPSASVRRVVRLPAAVLREVAGRPHVAVDGDLPRVASLRTFLGEPPAPVAEHQLALLVATIEGPVALLVDTVLDARRITRRPLHPRLLGTPAALGTTVLPSGEAVLVLNPSVCARDEGGAVMRVDAPEVARRPRVVLAEDAPTTRAVETQLLEDAGYEVHAAADGAAAWELLQRHGADLVVTDVEMPGLDGFELCRTIRADPRFTEVPVVIVSARSSDEDRHRGLEVGADAYLVKGGLDRDALLDTLERLR